MKKRVLIVDDNSTNLYMMETLLKGYGFEVTSAENGKDAIDKAILNPPDLIVTDILMPVMDGYALCRRWKSDDALKRIPLVFYTATYTGSKNEDFALSLGAERFIIKPQEPDILMNILKEVLEENYVVKQVATKPLEEEMEIFRQYNGILFKKLEKKMSDLEIANQELRASEDRYRSLFINSIDAVLLTIPDGRILAANPGACRIFGRTEEEICRIGGAGVIDQTDPRLAAALEERKRTGKFQGELTFVRKDGTLFPGEIASIIFKDRDGNQKTSIIIRDVTDRKRAEEALQESEERYRRVSSMTSDITYSCITKEDGRFSIDWMTGATERISGYSIEEIKAQSCWRFMVIEEDMALFEEKVVDLAPGSHGLCELRIRHKNGDIVWLVSHVECIMDKETPERFHLYGGLVDITASKQAEKALRDSEEQYRNLFENANEAIFIVQDRKLVFLNPITTMITGYSSEELMARPFIEFIHPDDRDMVINRHVRRLKGEELPHIYSFRIIHKDGSVKGVELNAVLINWNDKPATLNFLSDITGRKQAEEKLLQTLDSLRRAINTTVQVMVSAVEVRDPYTFGHQLRSADLARAIATEMGLPQEKIDGIRMAGSIHDIGKLSIPAEILSKPTKLTNIEFSLIKEHSRKGYEMLKDVESPWPLAQIVYQHHERMDGSGYPRNLKGNEILMEARIMAVADVVESMASHRPYRPALGIGAALEEIEKNKGTLYDAGAVDVCLRLFREKGFQLERV